jgi:hypothetical protein
LVREWLPRFRFEFLFLTVGLAPLLVETLLLLVGRQELPGRLLFKDELLDGPPARLLLGEEVGVALLRFDDCAGDKVLF